MKKLKSQVFIFDLVTAVILIFISLALLSLYYIGTSENRDIYDTNIQIVSGLTQTGINSLNNQYVRELFIQGEIRNVENTVGQQIAEFYAKGEISKAEELSRAFIQSYITAQDIHFNFLIIDGENEYVLYNQRGLGNIDIEDSTISSTLSREVIGFINRSSHYGPYTMRVEIWK